MSFLALQDLFRRHREKATGVWILGREPGRTVYLDYGDTVFAQSTHVQDRLTYLLVERGKVTQAQMDYALSNLKPGLSIGKNLIEMGFITQRDLLDTAKAQVERIVREALVTPDQEPDFTEKELDANVVRLPVNTTQLFLGSILSIQDREGLLELLGPLNQVVVLQGRGLAELSLPQDLAGLTPFLDGTHTLLELSREGLAEPLRLGAFAIFLREMGWARLHEMPPLDKHVLDLALTPEPEPPSPPLAEALPETVPTLFSTIQEAERPTTNLEHLSHAMDHEVGDRLAEVEPEAGQDEEPFSFEPFPDLALPTDSEFAAAEAPPEPVAALPVLERPAFGATPALPLEPLYEEAEEPRVALKLPVEFQEPGPLPAAAADAQEPAVAREQAAQPEASAPGRGRRWLLAVLLVLVCVAGATYYWLGRATSTAPRVPPPPPPPRAVTTPGVAVPPPAPSASVPAPAPSSAAPAVAAAPPPTAPSPGKTAPAAPAAGTTAPAAPVAAPVTASTAPPAHGTAAPPPPVPAPSAKPAPVAAPSPAEPATVATSPAVRLKTLEQGDLATAVQQGRALVRQTSAGAWTLRLEIACLGETIQRLPETFKDREPDLFLLPMAMRDGRTCYQVLYGRFPSRQAAEQEVNHLPATFLANGNNPKPFRFGEIPKGQ